DVFTELELRRVLFRSVLEDAGIERSARRALLALEIAVEIDEYRLARLDVAHHPETGALEGHRFGGNHVFRPGLGLGDAIAQRPDTVRIAKAEHPIAGALRDHRIGAAHPLVQGRHRAEHRTG